jgi:hypothetical protein
VVYRDFATSAIGRARQYALEAIEHRALRRDVAHRELAADERADCVAASGGGELAVHRRGRHAARAAGT